jgi:hypothetical protein
MSVKKYFDASLLKFTRTFLTALLFIAATAYITAVLINNSDGLLRALERVSWWNIFASIFVAIPMYYFKAVYHLYSLKRISRSDVSIAIAIPAYLQSQIVRYLPGKIWGLIYQSQKMLSYATVSQVIMANIFQMLATNVLALGIVFSLLAAMIFDNLLFYVCIPLTFFAIEINHRFSYLEFNIIKLIVKFIPRINIELTRDCTPIKWKASILLMVEWLFYFSAFFVLLWGWYSPGEIFDIAIWYSAASLISLVFIFIPAGIIVREALFVSTASFFSGAEADLLVVASLLRLVWVLSEIGAAFLSSCYFRRGHSE